MIEDIIDGIIERERAPKGKPEFTNRPSDRGGPTKYGITQETLSSYLGRPATVEEVRNLTIPQSREIYRHVFVIMPGFDALDEPLRTQMVDFGVHSGAKKAITYLQSAVGVPVDGRIGPMTKAAIEKAGVVDVARRLWQSRFLFLMRLVEEDVRRKTGRSDTDAENAEGWAARMFKINPWKV